MIDVGGAALLGAAARNAAGVAAVGRPGALRQARHGAQAPSRPSARSSGRSSRPTRSACRRRLLRRDRRVPQPDLEQHVPEAGSRWSSRRSTTSATARTPTSAPRSTARRPTAAARSPTPRRSAATGRRSTTYLDLDAAYRIARDFTAPTVAIAKHTDPVGSRPATSSSRPTATPSRRTPVAAFGGIVGGQPRARRSDRPRDRRQLLRGGRRAGLRPGGAGDPRGEGRSGAPRDPARPDRGHARLRHRQPRLQARRRRAARRDPRRGRPRRGRLQVVTKRRPTLDELTDLLFAWRAVRHVRSNAIVLARNGGDGRHRRRPGQPPGLGRDRAPAGRRPGEDWRSWRQRRLLPVPGRDPDGGDRRRDGDHPARRLDPRRDGDRGRRPAPPGDGLHRPPPLPALTEAA